jgi:hypothetical protein
MNLLGGSEEILKVNRLFSEKPYDQTKNETTIYPTRNPTNRFAKIFSTEARQRICHAFESGIKC